MTRMIILLLAACLSTPMLADDFKVKLKIETVDHEKLGDASILIREGGNKVREEKVPNDGDIKLELLEGRVYELWILKKGYAPHVIHNVHANGDGKFKITLYRATTKYPNTPPPYHQAYRTFDNVKELTIPAELVNEHIHIVKEEELTPGEAKAIEDLEDEAKDQEKAQKKIENLTKDIEKMEDEKKDIQKDLKDGKIAANDAEKDIKKLEKKIKSAKKEIKSLDYP